MSLKNYETTNIQSEKYRLGTIIEITENKENIFNIPEELKPSAIFSVKVEDPYVSNYTIQEQEQFRKEEKEINDFAEWRRLEGHWDRKVGTAYIDENNILQENKENWGDPVSKKKFETFVGSLASMAWQSKIPSSSALTDLSDPFSLITISDNKGNEYPVDDTTRKWLSLCTDAVAIRNRSAIMSWKIQNFVKENPNKNKSLNQLSVACGTALTPLVTSQFLDIDLHLGLVDIDSKAMIATRKIAAEIGFKGTIDFTKRLNIFNTERMKKLKQELDDKNMRPSLLDLMGIFEYTGENLGVDPVNFLKSNYDILKDDGILIFGQMRDDRPLQDFTMGVIGWPYVETRSLKEFLQIIYDAEIPIKNTTIFLPDDEVYMIGVIQKNK